MLVTAMRSFGTIGGGRLEWEAMARARKLLAERRPRIALELPLGPAVGQCCGGHVRCGCAGPARRSSPSWRPPRRAAAAACPLVLLFGAGHVGRALAAALAPLPLRLRWIDGRAGEFPDRARAPASRSSSPSRPLAVIERRRPVAPLSSSPTATPRLHARAAPSSRAATSPISA